MTMDHGDEFKLRFQAGKDSTLRRISIAKIIFSISIPVLFIMAGTVGHWSRQHDLRWPNIYGEFDSSSPYYIIGLLLLLVFLLSIISLIISNIIESKVFIRRYGWRAVSDPIEAQRIAMREALYDVAMGSAQAMPDHDDDRLIVVPTRRLRPVQARLELTAEREKERARRET